MTPWFSSSTVGGASSSSSSSSSSHAKAQYAAAAQGDEPLSVATVVKLLTPPKQATNIRFSSLLLDHCETLLQDWAVVLSTAETDTDTDTDDRNCNTGQQQQQSSSSSSSNKRSNNNNNNKSNFSSSGRNNNNNNNNNNTLKWSKLQGRLHLCTKSLVFEPQNVQRPILRFPFSKMEAPPRECNMGNNNNNNNNNNNDSDPDGINTPERLGLEATIIHQNFSQQILKTKNNERKEMELPNPFFDEDDNDGMEPASVAYRYRQFDLGDDVQLVCRTELHGTVKNDTTYMTAFCLNEYPTAGATAWRDRLDAQRGAVLATELKNNSFKLAKWTASSLLAGADQMKIGFVSRTAPKNAYEHAILGTQFYRPKDFAAQITLKEGQMWAMIRMFIQILRKQPDDFGKYVLMRDPNKAMLRLFKVPPTTFDEEDDEEEEEEEEKEE
mmetsp:Transcript_15584/g.26047  ORF Transcript_15584/g.26047 Transcript_15584/m.26047 type:complete len:440 (+) Transcript_15584:88-1407(+)